MGRVHRRHFLIDAGVLLAAPLAARAQRTTTIRRIGDLNLGAPDTPEEIQRASAPLRKLGWMEGQNLLVERRYANGRVELLRPLAEELAGLKVELIVTGGTAATLAAKSATNTIPIVFAIAADPIRTGLVASLAQPGGNVTGYSIVSADLDAKRLEVLRELLPAMRRVGVLENPTNPYFRAARKELEQASRALGIQLIVVEAATAGELAHAVAEVARQGGQALLISPDILSYENRAEIMRVALKHGLPTTSSRSYLETGALVSYTNALSEQENRVATYIDRILRGARPEDLPVEQPTKFELGINLKTAEALGITVPQSLRARADLVIE